MTEVNTPATQRPINHWALFSVLFAIGVFIVGATSNNYFYAAGYMAVPAVVGYFATRKATTVSHLLGGYALFVGFMAMLGYQHLHGDYEDAKKGFFGGCMGNKQAAAALSEAQLQSYCTCMSDKVAPRAHWELIKASLTFKPPPPVPEIPAMVDLITKSSTECVASLPK